MPLSGVVPMPVPGVVPVPVPADGGSGSGSPSIHHFFVPLTIVQTKVFPLCSLTVLKPSSAIGHVRPGAAVPCGYPSSRFAAVAGVSSERSSAEVAAKRIATPGFLTMSNLTVGIGFGELSDVSPTFDSWPLSEVDAPSSC